MLSRNKIDRYRKPSRAEVYLFSLSPLSLFKRGGVSELSDTQSVDRSQTTSFLFQFTEDTPNRDRFKKHLVPEVFSRFRNEEGAKAEGGGTMLQDGSSWRQPMRRRPALPDCTARPTGWTDQPPAACTKPFNGLCGQGALLVAQATVTHVPCELWLHYCIEKYAPRKYVGRGGCHSESA